MAQTPLKNIKRIDIASTGQHGWQVRTTIGGTHRSKWFSDKKFGNAAFALGEATVYRNVMIDVLSK